MYWLVLTISILALVLGVVSLCLRKTNIERKIIIQETQVEKTQPEQTQRGDTYFSCIIMQKMDISRSTQENWDIFGAKKQQLFLLDGFSNGVELYPNNSISFYRHGIWKISIDMTFNIPLDYKISICQDNEENKITSQIQNHGEHFIQGSCYIDVTDFQDEYFLWMKHFQKKHDVKLLYGTLQCEYVGL